MVEPRRLLAPLLGACLGMLGPTGGPAHAAPCARYDPLRSAFFGDTHVHTAFSQDASTQGTRNTPRDAYRFARGEALGIQPYDGQDRPLRRRQLARPLDFAVVTDHAEQLGEVAVCSTPGLPGYGSLVCRAFRHLPRLAFLWMNMRSTWYREPERFGFCGAEGEHCRAAALSRWEQIQQAAEEAQDRSPACAFTSFVGYEWTGATRAKNLHRNVVFADRNVPRLPISFFEAPAAEALREALRSECLDSGTGCDALVIPHNPNLSGGTMFQPAGARPDARHARLQARLERLAEVMQHKGDSECQLGAGSVDEHCAFEKLPYDDFQGRYVRLLSRPPQASSFLRWALREGLRLQPELGVNPYKFGLLASTDTHLGTPGDVDEGTHPGHGGAGRGARQRLPEGLVDEIEFNPGGLAVLWAEENSRAALFAAMRRREVYGTSGPRLQLRFFGGWSLPGDLCERQDFAARGYAAGVPMGGDLPRPGARARAPRFAMHALRDAGVPGSPGTQLQRIQIVKGWLEGDATQERVFEVAGDPDNGASVDLASCTPRGGGFDSLCSVWTDPDFDPRQSAFYYARVLENPTCRWSAHACLAAGVDCASGNTPPPGFEPCCAADHRWSQQERAWSSPIWYEPGGFEPGA